MKRSTFGRPVVFGRAARGLALAGLSVAVVLSSRGVVVAEDGGTGAGADGVAVVCTAETYTWTGTATVAEATDIVSTGISVAAQLGARLVVVGSSADGLDTNGHAVALAVSVGAVMAAPGAAVDAGGAIAVHGPVGGAASGPLTVSGATVVIDRCADVASGAAAPVPSTTIVSEAGALAPTTAPPAAVRAPSSSTLPSTGSSGASLLAAAAGGLIAIGLVLRRSATGRDLAPGSLPAVRPRDPR